MRYVPNALDARYSGSPPIDSKKPSKLYKLVGTLILPTRFKKAGADEELSRQAGLFLPTYPHPRGAAASPANARCAHLHWRVRGLSLSPGRFSASAPSTSVPPARCQDVPSDDSMMSRAAIRMVIHAGVESVVLFTSRASASRQRRLRTAAGGHKLGSHGSGSGTFKVAAMRPALSLGNIG